MTAISNEDFAGARSDGAPSAPESRADLNGQPACAADFRALALTNYGHFTSMQVVDGRVRGLELHLDRLDRATRELFGCALDTAAVRRYMRRTIGGETAARSLRVTVFSRGFQRDRPILQSAPDVLTTIAPARGEDDRPLRLKTFRYVRALPHVKHVGTFGLFHHRRLAQMAGFDDALFVDAGDAVSEASIWNVGFFDGSGIVWPNAPGLSGVSMELLQKGLRMRGIATTSGRVTRSDLAAYRSAFLTNSSCPVRPIAAIDDVELKVDDALTATLRECYASNPLQEI